MKTRKFLPNQFEFLGKKIYVAQNHASASDENPGTADKPFKTISAAMKVLKPADHVYIDAGIYREEVPLPTHGHYYVPNSQVHFHAIDGAEVYLKGSDVFEADWQQIDGGLWQADLPASLFAENAYNPYQLSLVLNDDAKVRPCSDQADMPETRGQIYVDGQAYEQLKNAKAVEDCAGSFIVAGDGRSIIVHFAEGDSPDNCEIELTVRQKCIKPEFDGTIMMQVHGMCVEHAAEPGAFCRCRDVGKTRFASGVEVEKRLCWAGAAGNGCTLMEGQPAYVSRDSDRMVASVCEDTRATRFYETECLEAYSDDGGKNWEVDEGSRASSGEKASYSYTNDEKAGVLMRHWRDYPHGMDPHGAFGNVQHNVMFQFSRDDGKTWSQPKLIDDKKIYCFSILPLADGSYIWPYTTNTLPAEQGHHSKFCTLIGRLNDSGTDIDWRNGGGVEVTPQESDHGVDEPSLAQFPDGRLIVFFRQGSKSASQEHPGITSVKLWSISEDSGKTWSKPQPLCYEDGKYVYSPRAYHIAFRAIKNNRVYIAMNIAKEPCHNCDPRTHLYLVEIDPKTLTANRDRLTVIDQVHPEHHHLVRFSNFQFIQERKSRNAVIFMKLAASEYCPIWQGYDQNMYRYEIFLPE